MKNIPYTTAEIENYFSKNRVSWPQFYESEKYIISGLGLTNRHTILDVGCGCGGLGLALKDQFGVVNYVGVEINQQAASTAKYLNPLAEVYVGDFLDVSKSTLSNTTFDIVFSLSCFDWNIQFSEMLNVAWSHVSPGGHLVVTLRLVAEPGCSDHNQSYQYINYDGLKEGERAAYIVLNVNDLFSQLQKLNPFKISAYGYFGSPSSTAVTPYEQICFCAIAIQKKQNLNLHGTSLRLDLPEEILQAIDEFSRKK